MEEKTTPSELLLMLICVIATMLILKTLFGRFSIHHNKSFPNWKAYYMIYFCKLIKTETNTHITWKFRRSLDYQITLHFNKNSKSLCIAKSCYTIEEWDNLFFDPESNILNILHYKESDMQYKIYKSAYKQIRKEI